MRIRTLSTLALGAGLATSALYAQQPVQQPRGGGSEWLTSRGDAQATSWVRTDTAISAEALSKPGFALQWKEKLDNAPRQGVSLHAGVSANGVTLFVPMSLVAGSSNNVFALDGDTGVPVWSRHIDAPLPAAATAACPGGITGAATRIVEVVPAPVMAPRAGGPARGGGGYRSLISEPGAGAPIEGRGGAAPPPAGRAGAPSAAPGAAGAPGAAAPPAGAAGAPPAGAGAAAGGAAGQGRAGAAPGQGAAAGAGGGGGRGGGATGNAGIPGAPNNMPGGGFGRPAGVVYVIASDGQLHVLGLPSGKDIQKPAPFVPAGAKFADLVAVGETLYTSTSGGCNGAPNGVWAIDLASPEKPVTSWKTNGGNIVGSIAFGTDGTLLAAIGPGQAAAGGYANALVALDPKTLQPKSWFTQPNAEFVTGPIVFKRNDKDVVAAATKDGRVLLFDAASVGGANHTTTLAASKPVTPAPAPMAADALALWQEMVAPADPAGGGAMRPGQTWLLVPVTGGIVALKVTDAGLEPGWTSRPIANPVTPLVVNGVVFAVASGKPAAAGGRGTGAVVYALEGTTGKELWNSGTTVTSYVPGHSLWAADSQVLVADFAGTVYSFGFLMERR